MGEHPVDMPGFLFMVTKAVNGAWLFVLGERFHGGFEMVVIGSQVQTHIFFVGPAQILMHSYADTCSKCALSLSLSQSIS